MKHAKLQLALSCSLALLMIGCNEEGQKPSNLPAPQKQTEIVFIEQSFITTEGTVVMNSYTKDAVNRTIWFDIVLQSPNNGATPGNYRIGLGEVDRQDGKSGGWYSLQSTAREMLFALDLAWDTLDLSFVEITERTPIESLWMKIASTDEGFREEYIFSDGDSASFEYLVKASELEFNNPAFAKPWPNSELSLGERATAFFSRHTSSTLNANENGELLVSLVGNSEFQSWLDLEFPTSHRNKDDGDKKLVCRLAELCAAIKCIFGGALVNPVCAGCAGTLIGCLFDKLFTGFDW